MPKYVDIGGGRNYVHLDGGEDFLFAGEDQGEARYCVIEAPGSSNYRFNSYDKLM